MYIAEKLKKHLDQLSLRKRMIYSNILMFLIPVAVTVITALGVLGIASYAFIHFYLPRMGLTVKELHEMGEQYEGDLKSFLILITVLCLVMLILLCLSIIFTSRFLTRFMIRRLEKPLNLLTEGVANISAGHLEYTIYYPHTDEFAPVCAAFNDMANRLKKSAEQLASEEQHRKELFAGISHDLRSPLTSVRAYTEALLDGVAKTPEDMRRYLNKIQLHEAEIEHMVEALFLYTKMGLKDYPVHLQTLNIRQELLRICEKNPSDKHLSIDTAAVLPYDVTADPFLLERVILNLLDNSYKYRRGEVAHITIHTSHESDGILLSFSDDGIGVAEELLSRLFDPFYRTDPARNHPAGGSGLGLAIVREAVNHIGGKVWAEKPSGGGLCIQILMKEAGSDAEHFDY